MTVRRAALRSRSVRHRLPAVAGRAFFPLLLYALIQSSYPELWVSAYRAQSESVRVGKVCVEWQEVKCGAAER